jgi:hypothetical protein
MVHTYHVIFSIHLLLSVTLSLSSISLLSNDCTPIHWYPTIPTDTHIPTDTKNMKLIQGIIGFLLASLGEAIRGEIQSCSG